MTPSRKSEFFKAQTTATAQGKRHGRRYPAVVEQGADRQIIGVVRFEAPLGVNNGIDRLNHTCRRIDFIDQGHARFFEGHGHGTTTNTQRTYTADSGTQILGGKGLIDVVKPERFVEIVMKARAEIAGSRRKRHAQRGVFGQLSRHLVIRFSRLSIG